MKKVYPAGIPQKEFAMSVIKRLGLFLLLAAIPFSAAAQIRPRLAVLPFTGGSGGDGDLVADLFSYAPELQKVFTVIPRTSSTDAIMREQQFQRSSGLTDTDTIARLGRQHNADFVVAGHIQTLGTSKLILITIVKVETLQQLAGDYREYRDIEEIQGLIPDMARRIISSSRLNTADLPRLAIFPFIVSDAGASQQDAEVLAQLLATEIANTGKYAVLPRTSTINAVMEEHRIQRSGLTESENIQVLGRAVNAQYVLAGTVRRLGQSSLFTAAIRHVEDGSQVTGNAVNFQSVADGLKLMQDLGERLAGSTQTPENMALVQGGTFLMGSSDYGPAHTVRVRSFYMGKYEVTQAEWEFAAKGGNKDYITFEYSGGNNPDEVAWYGDNSGYKTQPVGTKMANILGLYDMSGNVYEGMEKAERLGGKTLHKESEAAKHIQPCAVHPVLHCLYFSPINIVNSPFPILLFIENGNTLYNILNPISIIPIGIFIPPSM
jgi:TolB-like protein